MRIKNVREILLPQTVQSGLGKVVVGRCSDIIECEIVTIKEGYFWTYCELSKTNPLNDVIFQSMKIDGLPRLRHSKISYWKSLSGHAT